MVCAARTAVADQVQHGSVVRRSSPHTAGFPYPVCFIFLAQRSLRAASWPWATHHVDDVRSRSTATCHGWDACATRSALGCVVSPCASDLRRVLCLAVRACFANGRSFYHTTIARQLDIDIISSPGWPGLRDVRCAGVQCACLDAWWSATGGCSVRAVGSLFRYVLGSLVAPEAVRAV